MPCWHHQLLRVEYFFGASYLIRQTSIPAEMVKIRFTPITAFTLLAKFFMWVDATEPRYFVNNFINIFDFSFSTAAV